MYAHPHVSFHAQRPEPMEPPPDRESQIPEDFPEEVPMEQPPEGPIPAPEQRAFRFSTGALA
jgi:hypothetical protein